MFQLFIILTIGLAGVYYVDPTILPADVPVPGLLFGWATVLLIWILRRI
ncbi:hypothetical protein [Coralliovum pocilloporae]